MQDGRYRHVPVVDDGKVVRVVLRFDFSGPEVDHLSARSRLSPRPRDRGGDHQ
jgi:hypothetical protein